MMVGVEFVVGLKSDQTKPTTPSRGRKAGGLRGGSPHQKLVVIACLSTRFVIHPQPRTQGQHSQKASPQIMHCRVQWCPMGLRALPKRKQVLCVPQLVHRAAWNPHRPAQVTNRASHHTKDQSLECASAAGVHITKPYEFIGFGAMEVTKPYEFIGFGAMECMISGWLGEGLCAKVPTGPHGGFSCPPRPESDPGISCTATEILAPARKPALGPYRYCEKDSCKTARPPSDARRPCPAPTKKPSKAA
jgi:hypothetical protein